MASQSLNDLTRRDVSRKVLWHTVEKSMDLDVRSAVIINTALIERGLERLIKSRLRRLNSKDKQAFFGPNGAFASLASKIRIAYALGIIGPATRADLSAINDIRNVFAHSPTHITLANKILKQKVLGIRMFHAAAKHAEDSKNRMFNMKNLPLTPAGYLIYAIGTFAVFIGSDRQRRIPPKKLPITFFGFKGRQLLL